MKTYEILFVYKWASMGGVERVILNRAHVLKRSVNNLVCDVHFLVDAGGKEQFKKYIKDYGLCGFINVVDEVDYSRYDLVFSIDTPEIFESWLTEDLSKLFIECHTAYRKNRAYLKSLPQGIKGIIAPSEFMVNEIKSEVSSEMKEKVFKLANDVFISDTTKIAQPKIFSRIPILYLGRLDRMKNIKEIIEIVSYYNSKKDNLILIIAGELIEHDINLEGMLKKYNMDNRTVYLPPIRFEKTADLIHLVKAHQGIFMSASLQESFALSAAEAIVNEVPVLLFNNPAHSNLVNENEQYLFYMNRVEDALNKLDNILENYDYHAKVMREYSHQLKNQFIHDWRVHIQPLLNES